MSRIMLFQLSLLLTSFRYFRVPFPRILVRPFCWAFYFCRSFSPLLTLPLRRRLTYPPFYRWIFCLLTVRFFRLHLRNAPGCGFSWSCPRTWVGLRKKRRKKKEEERNLVFSGDRGPAMTASFSRLCPLETRWWAYTSRDWLSRWPFITASLDPSGTFVPQPEGIPWLRTDWWTRM